MCTGFSRTTLWRLRQAGEFPEPVYVNGNARLMRWREEDVLKWRAARETAAPAEVPAGRPGPRSAGARMN